MYGKRGTAFFFLLFTSVSLFSGCGKTVDTVAQTATGYVKSDSQYYDAACLQGLGAQNSNVAECAVSRGIIQQRGSAVATTSTASLTLAPTNLGTSSNAASSTALSPGMNSQQLTVWLLAAFAQAEMCAYLHRNYPCYSQLGVVNPTPPPQICPMYILYGGNGTGTANGCIDQTWNPTPSPSPAPTPTFACASQLLQINALLNASQTCNTDADCSSGIESPTDYCGTVPFSQASGNRSHLDTLINAYRPACLGSQAGIACYQYIRVYTCQSHVCH